MRKKIVPPREERLANMGEAKTPKMGKFTPQSVEVSPVDDLLSEMQKAVAPPTTRVRFMPPENGEWRFVSFDLGTQSKSIYNNMYGDGRCNHGCGCPPCRRGDCGNCTVDAQRNSDRDTVRAYVAKYRGVKLP